MAKGKLRSIRAPADVWERMQAVADTRGMSLNLLAVTTLEAMLLDAGSPAPFRPLPAGMKGVEGDTPTKLEIARQALARTAHRKPSQAAEKKARRARWGVGDTRQ